ncbi:ATP-binding protein [Roseateles sp. L2-2]|uniref:ATP-binding protein n=1 Tax=Roseateles sp. L2-2 TaxID=3422597 RepID=UPI003D36F42E
MSDVTPAPAPDFAFAKVQRFGSFTLDPARKLLLDDGRAVRLGGRALDLLIALVERAGEVVSHDELFARVWPRTVVEESSLRVHLSALRKALGDSVDGRRYIASLPGRGYSFVMNVSTTDVDRPIPEAAPAAVPMTPRLLPYRLTGVVGREQELAVIAAKLERSRLVTVVATGGMGKTTVALALAGDAIERHADGACFVDLAPLDDPAMVPHALAGAIGVTAPDPCTWSILEEAIAPRDLLIVLDNCEHLAAAAADLAERVLRIAPRVRILATSREPLDAESEAVYRLDPLAVPPVETASNVEDALAFSALRLFVERATASAHDFRLSSSNLAAAITICRHLDGMPLAIELAAARVGSLGIHALADRLDDVFRLLRRGRRTVLPRHQTLQALLDWSYDLLDEVTRTVLHRLSVFRASFDLQAAAEVAGCQRIAPGTVTACVLDLVSRSLVELEPGGNARYRLLFVTRIYAAERLIEDGDAHAVRRRHALSIRAALGRANAELRDPRTRLMAWRSANASAIPDVRAALDWAHGPGADRLLGAELLVESGRLQLEIGLIDELLPRTLDALPALQAHGELESELGLRLLTLVCMMGGHALLDRAVPAELPSQLDALARRIGSPEQQRLALFALCVNAFGRGDYPTVVARADRFATLPVDPLDPTHAAATLTGLRFDALGRHYLGEHETAWAGSVRVLEHAGPWRAGTYMQMPLPVSMGVLQARIRWLQGFADEALDRALELLRFCEGAHPFALSHALSLAIIPILLWRGDDERALGFVTRLIDHELMHFQSFWIAWPHLYCKALALRGLDVAALRARLGDTERINEMQSDMLGTLAPRFVRPGDLQRVEAGIVGWCAPEVLRVEGERLGSEALLLRALTLARRQGARAWELRTATSLAALWRSVGRHDAAQALLGEVLAAITEGRGCVDVRRAMALQAAGDAVS